MYKRAFSHVHDTNAGDDTSFRYYVWQLGYGLFPWTGIAAGSLGVALSMLLLLGEVVRVMILVLRTPQAGVPVIQTQTESRAAWVSAIDVVRLLADVATLAGELVIVACTLWLLYRFTQVADDVDGAPAAP